MKMENNNVVPGKENKVVSGIEDHWFKGEMGNLRKG